MARKEASECGPFSPSKPFNDRKASMSVSGMGMDLTKCDSNFDLSKTYDMVPSIDRRSNFTSMRPGAVANKMKNRPSISIQDYIGQSEPTFGMSYYKTPSNEMLMKKI